MIQIHKQKEPVSLTNHRSQKNADYDNYPGKEKVRKSLYDEQRGICCYCLGPIADQVNGMKIEHFKCQANHSAQQLDYSNMLGACMGNEGQPREKQHCDTYKGNNDLKFNPATSTFSIQSVIRYGTDGTITSTDTEFNGQLNTVLNLNVVSLKNNRKAALDGFIKAVNQKHSGKFGKDMLQRWLNDYSGVSHQNGLKPYCQIIVYWLQKKLSQH